jgi:hypothetical protein
MSRPYIIVGINSIKSNKIFLQPKRDYLTAQVVMLLKYGGCGVAAKPPHHTPH